MSTHKITAEQRAVVEEMQRRRKLFVAARSKRRTSSPDSRAPRPSHAPAQRSPRLPSRRRRDRPARPALRGQSPVVTRARALRRLIPHPSKGRGSSGSSGEQRKHPSRRLPGGLDGREAPQEQVIELQDMNRSLLGIAQRAMSMAAKSAETMS